MGGRGVIAIISRIWWVFSRDLGFRFVGGGMGLFGRRVFCDQSWCIFPEPVEKLCKTCQIMVGFSSTQF